MLFIHIQPFNQCKRCQDLNPDGNWEARTMQRKWNRESYLRIQVPVDARPRMTWDSTVTCISEWTVQIRNKVVPNKLRLTSCTATCSTFNVSTLTVQF